ncbi:MAG: SpoIVB peptidase [Oscillospiraceae bacterium]|nr:SpoIVB peptidase [Oscillospiraceae bacterium]
MHEKHQHRIRRGAAAVFAALFCLSFCAAPAWAQESERTLIPLGKAVGIKLFADGVLIVETSELDSGGEMRSPAQDCGLKEGDLILRANNEKVQSTEHMQSILQHNGDDAMVLAVKRGSRTMEVSITPVCCDDGAYRLGAWIRDSMAGIGTLTYYDPATGAYGALGHGITDVDTARLMPLASGSIMETTVKAVRRGEKGQPGELKGDFSVQRDVGTLWANTESGIFGTVSDDSWLNGGEALPVGRSEDVHTGPATILSTVNGGETEEYAVQIEKLFSRDQSTRNMLIRVTDERLLSTTGGIVQGMSGSPIIQDGKLIGAVTHVLVNSPDTGYGIFIENMLEAAG